MNSIQFKHVNKILVGGFTIFTVAFVFAGGYATAQDKFPSETIEVVTHAGAGGGTDVTTRMMMLRGRRSFKADMVVVSKRGGGGALAMKYIDSRPRDGHTIMTITPTHLMTIIRGKSPLKLDDLVGLGRATDDPQILMVSAKSSLKSADDLLKVSKGKALKWGITGIGGIDHVTSYTFGKRAGIKLDVVPFKGGGDIVTNLIGGNIDVGVLNLSEADAQVKAGQITPLLVLAEKRMSAIGDTPTAKEKGINAVFSTVRGFVTLKGVPEERLKILEAGIQKAMKHNVYQSYLKGVGLTPASVTPRSEWEKQFRQLYKDAEVSLKELGMVE